MAPIVLTHSLTDGTTYEATFLPDQGMNLASFKRGNIEVIDQSTRKGFDERFAGLGPLIGPHFHRKRPALIPKYDQKTLELFPHIKRCLDAGIEDPFSHGIARYAAWKAESGKDFIKAKITGKDEWNGVPLAKLEGQQFIMEMTAALSSKGLSIHLSVVSDTDSLVGTHYFYRLPNGKGRVVSHVGDKCYRKGELVPVPSEWLYNGHELNFDLAQDADYTFFPAPDPLKGDIWLETEEYRLKTHTECDCQESSWQLYHPHGASFVCIEPVSAQDPRHPNLSVSALTISLQIEPLQKRP